MIWASAAAESKSARIDIEQAPSWSKQDMDFFLHGSMSTEVVPENVLRAFTGKYFATTLSGVWARSAVFAQRIGTDDAQVAHAAGSASEDISSWLSRVR